MSLLCELLETVLDPFVSGTAHYMVYYFAVSRVMDNLLCEKKKYNIFHHLTFFQAQPIHQRPDSYMHKYHTVSSLFFLFNLNEATLKSFEFPKVI